MDISHNSIKVVKAGPNTIEQLRALADLARRSADSNRPLSAFVEAAEGISPAMKEIAEEIRQRQREKNPGQKWWLALGAAITAVISSCNLNIDIDVNDLVRQVLAHMESSQQQQ